MSKWEAIALIALILVAPMSLTVVKLTDIWEEVEMARAGLHQQYDKAADKVIWVKPLQPMKVERP